MRKKEKEISVAYGRLKKQSIVDLSINFSKMNAAQLAARHVNWTEMTIQQTVFE